MIEHVLRENLHSNFIDHLGKDTIEIQTNVLKSGTKILLVDDLLATGGMLNILIDINRISSLSGTLAAAQELCLQIGCEVVETLVIIELMDLNGRERLANHQATSFLQFCEKDLEAIADEYADRVHQPKDA